MREPTGAKALVVQTLHELCVRLLQRVHPVKLRTGERAGDELLPNADRDLDFVQMRQVESDRDAKVVGVYREAVGAPKDLKLGAGPARGRLHWNRKQVGILTRVATRGRIHKSRRVKARFELGHQHPKLAQYAADVLVTCRDLLILKYRRGLG